jgi:hypothetical protein
MCDRDVEWTCNVPTLDLSQRQSELKEKEGEEEASGRREALVAGEVANWSVNTSAEFRQPGPLQLVIRYCALTPWLLRCLGVTSEINRVKQAL